MIVIIQRLTIFLVMGIFHVFIIIKRGFILRYLIFLIFIFFQWTIGIFITLIFISFVGKCVIIWSYNLLILAIIYALLFRFVIFYDLIFLILIYDLVIILNFNFKWLLTFVPFRIFMALSEIIRIIKSIINKFLSIINLILAI